LAAAGREVAVAHLVVLAEQLRDLFSLQMVVVAAQADVTVEQAAGFAVQVELGLAAGDNPFGILDIDVAVSARLATAARIIELVGAQHGRTLGQYRVAARDYGVGLVVIDEFGPAHVGRNALMRNSQRAEALGALCVQRAGRREQQQRTDRRPQQFTERLQRTILDGPGGTRTTDRPPQRGRPSRPPVLPHRRTPPPSLARSR